MIQISENNGEQMVDARELHSFLEVARDFSTWIKDRIEKYRFVEGRDYIVLESSPDRGNVLHAKKDYALTLDIAKSIAMVQNNDKGDEVRQYFISCEKKLNQIRKQITPLGATLENALRQMVESEVGRITAEIMAEMRLAVSEVKALGGTAQIESNFVTIAGFLSLIGVKYKTENEIKILGQRVSRYCKGNGIPITKVHSPKWGKVNAYPKEVLEMLIGDAA